MDEPLAVVEGRLAGHPIRLLLYKERWVDPHNPHSLVAYYMPHAIPKPGPEDGDPVHFKARHVARIVQGRFKVLHPALGRPGEVN